MIKRYVCGNGDGMLDDQNFGEWVEYSEHYKIESELREQVRSLREGLGEMISTIERNAVDNRATIENVKLLAKSWREELLTETEGYEQGLAK